jgi:hypothetical protein
VPTDADLAKINQFTRRPFTADEIYVGQVRLANNCIDRDNERFSEEVLQRFAATAIRKTLMFDHERDVREGGLGKIYDVTIEKMALQQANSETGEDLVLPAGISDVQFLTISFYIPSKAAGEEVIIKIDAGIYDFASIGFRCESMVPIMDPKDGSILFWEYRGVGKRTEMTEASLVYLGAQHGMSVKSADKDSPNGEITDPPEGKGISQKGGADTMEKFLKMLARLFPGKTFTEDGVESELRSAMVSFHEISGNRRNGEGSAHQGTRAV